MERDELQDTLWNMYSNFYRDLYDDNGDIPFSVYVKYSALMLNAISLARQWDGITELEYAEILASYHPVFVEMLEAARLRKKGY